MFDRSIARSTGRSLGGQERARGGKEEEEEGEEEKVKKKEGGRRKEEEECRKGKHKEESRGGVMGRGNKIWAGGTKFGVGELCKNHFGKTSVPDLKPKGSLPDCVWWLVAGRFIRHGDGRQEA